MNRFNHKKLSRLYLKQGIISLILLILTIYLSIVSSWTTLLFPPSLSNISDLFSDTSIEDSSVVELQLDKLYYTGYDNTSGNKINGHYYYAIQDNRCLFLLLDKTENTPKETMENFKGICKITRNDTMFQQLTTALAEDMDWSFESLQKICLPVIASQPDYHHIPTICLTAVLFLCIIVFGYSFISNFYYYFKYF